MLEWKPKCTLHFSKVSLLPTKWSLSSLPGPWNSPLRWQNKIKEAVSWSPWGPLKSHDLPLSGFFLIGKRKSLSRSYEVTDSCSKRQFLTDVYFFFFKIYFIYLFLAVWGLHCCARGLCLFTVSRGYSSLRCAGFSLRWLLLLQSTGSRRESFSSRGSQALERRL